MPAVVYGPQVNTAVVLWVNRFNQFTIQNPSFGNRINVTDPATWSNFAPSISNANIEYYMNQPYPIDGFGISSHTLATNGARVRLQYSNDSTVWFNAFTDYAPLTDDDILIIFPEITAQYWRVNFTGGGFSVGVIFGGRTLKFPHSPVDGYKPLHHARRYTKLFNDSIKGQFLGNRVLSSGAETDVDMGFFERTWIEGNIRGFESHFNQGGTFFYAGCPSKYPLDMGYCRAGGDEETLNIEWTEADKMATLDFSVRAYVG